MTLLELARRVDPLTAVLMVAFWVRWEIWRTGHRKHHVTLGVATNTEVPANV